MLRRRPGTQLSCCYKATGVPDLRYTAARCTASGTRGHAMTHHTLETPVTEAQVRVLKIGDTVTLEKTLFGIRDANLIAMFDKGRRTIFDMKGHAVVHTAPNV